MAERSLHKNLRLDFTVNGCVEEKVDHGVETRNDPFVRYLFRGFNLSVKREPSYCTKKISYIMGRIFAVSFIRPSTACISLGQFT